MLMKVLLILQIFFMISINAGKKYLIETKNGVRDKGNGSDYGYYPPPSYPHGEFSTRPQSRHYHYDFPI